MRFSSTAITRQYSPAPRHLDAGELLADHRPALVARHRRDVVDAVGVGHEAVIPDLLRDLFDGAVQIPDVGDRLPHHLAVGLDHEAQHPVRARMLRPHAERHLLGREPVPHDVDLDSADAAHSMLSRFVEMPWYSVGST